MEKLYRILKIFLWCAIGIFVGQSIYQCYDYYARPGLYASNSAPWYTSILLSGVVTLIIVLLMLLASVDKGIHNKTTKYGLPTY